MWELKASELGVQSQPGIHKSLLQRGKNEQRRQEQNFSFYLYLIKLKCFVFMCFEFSIM